MDPFAMLVIVAIIGILPAKIADNKGHSYYKQWFFGFLLFIVALPCSLFLKDISGKQCPACKEFVNEKASICKHCKTFFSGYENNY